MTSQELKYNLLNSNRISFRCDNIELLIKLEELLVKNEWTWRGHGKGVLLVKNKISHNVILHSNYYGHESKTLSYGSIGLDDTSYVFDVNEYTFKHIKFYFNPVPNYKPKKFSK